MDMLVKCGACRRQAASSASRPLPLTGLAGAGARPVVRPGVLRIRVGTRNG